MGDVVNTYAALNNTVVKTGLDNWSGLFKLGKLGVLN